MPVRLLCLRNGSKLLLAGLLLLAGCQSCTSTEETPPAVTTEQSINPRALATDYLRYTYQGALLSSDHPLNDSLSALMTGAIGGSTLTIIDTFSVESVEETGTSEHTVQVRFPRSVQIESGTWTLSAPATDTRRSIQIRGSEVYEAPYVAGWPAFQRHLRDVAPAAADTVLERAGAALNRTAELEVE